ncbi:MAG: hypothetical protein Q8P67_18495 [archaeon]|nr:hypothetical protein [archaeon]
MVETKMKEIKMKEEMGFKKQNLDRKKKRETRLATKKIDQNQNQSFYRTIEIGGGEES